MKTIKIRRCILARTSNWLATQVGPGVFILELKIMFNPVFYTVMYNTHQVKQGLPARETGTYTE
jgi:hypothetical protein